jgi:protein gp37
MSKSKIQWTERTWNPVTGCSKVSEGCRHCYAETMAKRLQGMGQQRYANAFSLTIHPDALDEPKQVKKPSMFFVCSMADLFHKDVPFEFVDKVMETIEACPRHTFQILTKRPERMVEYFIGRAKRLHRLFDLPDNVWVGVTVESEREIPRISVLRRLLTHSKNIKFISCEPLLGDLGMLNLAAIDLVIVGGESGPQARPMQKQWVLNIKRQCEEQCVNFFFKQWGTFGEDGVKRNKKANGCTIDGKIYQTIVTP